VIGILTQLPVVGQMNMKPVLQSTINFSSIHWISDFLLSFIRGKDKTLSKVKVDLFILLAPDNLNTLNVLIVVFHQVNSITDILTRRNKLRNNNSCGRKCGICRWAEI